MDRFLIKLEVSRKQDYIFGSKRLRDNAERSAEIDFVTGHLTRESQRDFFREAAGDLYDREKNLVYAGGGHAVLQFDSAQDADAFARRVTRTAMERFPGMELFVKRMEYDENILPPEKRGGPVQRKTAAANLRGLSRALEEKKDLRQYAVRQESFGVEKLDPTTFQPLRVDTLSVERLEDVAAPPKGYDFTTDLKALCGTDNFAAVVHIDGNSMGTRVNEIYDRDEETDWEGVRSELRTFSDTVDAAFKAAFNRTAEYVASQLDQAAAPPEGKAPVLPIRPVILAGDDVCFVTRGSIGLECARLFLEYLAHPAEGTPYCACAGVAIVHQKYPFHKAYELAEQLCSNAKKFVAEIRRAATEKPKAEQTKAGKAEAGPSGETKCAFDISALDWHIEFGQLRGGLDEIRRACQTEDTYPRIRQGVAVTEHRHMELRPVALLYREEPGDDSPGGEAAERFRAVYEDKTGGVRTYSFFKALCLAMLGEYGQTARGKIKDLRGAFKQGKVESSYFLGSQEAVHLLDRAFPAQYPTEREQIARLLGLSDLGTEDGKHQFTNALPSVGGPSRSGKLFSGKSAERMDAFKDVDGVSRCLFFDAIEMIDHFVPLDSGAGKEAAP